MISINDLVQKIRSTDKILIESNDENYADPIDMNRDDWLEKAKLKSQEFLKEHYEIIMEVSEDILFDFDKFGANERKIVLDEISNTKHLYHYLQIPLDEKQYFRYAFLLVIVRNLGLDSRDAFLEINELVKDAERKNVDYKKLLKELIPLADDTDKHGMGSIREIFRSIVQ